MIALRLTETDDLRKIILVHSFAALRTKTEMTEDATQNPVLRVLQNQLGRATDTKSKVS